MAPADEPWERQVVDAVRGVRYGSVEIVVHDGRVVQIERRVKVRLDVVDRRRPDDRGRERNQNSRADRATGGSEPPDTGEEKNR